MCINETIYMLFIDGLQNQVTKDMYSSATWYNGGLL